jgi:hypothetical protein
MKKKYFLLFFLLLAILPYCYLSFFANPSADDFSLSGQAQQNDFFHLMYHNYFFWNGRYISNIFIYLNPIRFGSFIIYKSVPFLMIGLLVLVNFSLVKQILNEARNNLIFSLVLTLLYLHNMPIISEGIYWFTGSVIYLLGIIILLFYLSVLIKTVRGEAKWNVFFLCLLLFLACGFNEVLTLLIVFLLGVVAYIFYKNNLPKKRLIGFQFLFSIAFASIMIFSPGNSFRQEVYENTHNFFHSFLYSFLQTGRFSFTWATSIPLISTSLLYFSINKEMREKSELFQNSFYLNRWMSVSLLFLIIFVCVFPPYWATGVLGQHRTPNVAYFFFLITWFINLTVWYNYYQKKLVFSLTKNIKRTLFGFLMVGLLLTSNGYGALSDIFSGSAKNYNEQMNSRYTKLKKSKPERDEPIIFSPIQDPPKCLFVSDITDNPEDWTNHAYNLYFCLDSTKIFLENN